MYDGSDGYNPVDSHSNDSDSDVPRSTEAKSNGSFPSYQQTAEHDEELVNPSGSPSQLTNTSIDGSATATNTASRASFATNGFSHCEDMETFAAGPKEASEYRESLIALCGKTLSQFFSLDCNCTVLILASNTVSGKLINAGRFEPTCYK